MARRRREVAGQLFLAFAVLDPAPAPAPVEPPPVEPVAPLAIGAETIAPPIVPLKRGRGRPRRESSSPLAPPTPRAKAEANSLKSRLILAIAHSPEIDPVVSGLAHALDADPATLGRVVSSLEYHGEVETWRDGDDMRVMLSAKAAIRLGLHLSTNSRRWVKNRPAVAKGMSYARA
jgi:hypothetical protein